MGILKKSVLYFGFAAILALISFASCEKEENENETKVSSYNSDESHNAGQNCMSCHKPNGSGEGWFTIAGTVYDSSKTSPYPNTTVKLFTGIAGSGILKATVEVDKYGNFYTTENIDFGFGLYTSVNGNSNTNHMNSPITTGQCNSCHGVSTDKIWTK